MRSKVWKRKGCGRRFGKGKGAPKPKITEVLAALHAREVEKAAVKEKEREEYFSAEGQ